MAKEGLSFANPYLAGANVGVPANPYTPFSPTSSIGAGGLGPSAADLAVAGEALVKQNQFTMPTLKQPPAIGFSPSKKQLFVNGLTFDADDAATALESEQFIGAPSTGLPQGGDWVPLDEQAYGQFLGSIRNPSLGRLAKKNFGVGVDQLQLLGGRGLQFLGAEQTGQAIVDQQAKDLAKTTPYVREFSDVDSANSAIDWLVATVAQQGPNILESIGVAAAGFFAGTATGGPLAGVGGAIAGLAGKSAFKQATLAAVKKKAAGEALDQAETKLLREAAGIAGATIATTASNYGLGIADIYGEQRDQGQEGDRLSALAGAIPYAALESLPEFVLASRLFGRGGLSRMGAPTALKDIQGTNMLTTGTKRAGELLKRGTKGAAVGGTLEGLTEVGQEALVLGLSDQDLSSPESQKRLLESFAAGFAVGGTIGTVANLRKGPLTSEPTDLLNPSGTVDPQSEAGTGLVTTTQEGGQPVGPTTVTGFGERPDFVAGAQGVRPATTQDRIFTGELPPGVLGEQGVLDIFGPEGATVGELRQRSRVADPLLGLPAPAAEVSPGQGVLQFAPEAPPPTGTVPMNPIQLAMQRAQQQDAFRQAEQQAAQQRQAEVDRLAIAAQNQRQLDIANTAAQQEQLQQSQQPPMLPVRERVPQQMSLFPRGMAPKPSARERLRRGVSPLVRDLPPLPSAPVDLRTVAQAPLFTQQGQPSIAAERAAGRRQAAIPQIETGAIQLPATGKKVTPAMIAKAKAAAEKRAAEVKTSVEKLKAKKDQVSIAWVADNETKAQTAKGEVIERNGVKYVKFQTGTLENGKPTYGYIEQSKAIVNPTKKQIAALEQEAKAAADKKRAEQDKKKAAEVTPPKEPTPPKGGKLKAQPKKTTTEAKGAADKTETLRRGTTGMGLAGLVQQVAAEPEARAKKDTTTSDETQRANEAIQAAIETAETTKNPREYNDAVYDIVEVFATESNAAKLSRKLVDEFLSNGGMTSIEFKAVLRDVALDQKSIDRRSRMFQLLADNDLLTDPEIMASGVLPQVKGVVEPKTQAEKDADPVYYENRLSDLINNRDGYLNRNQLVTKAKELYTKIKDTEYVVGERGVIADFFTEDGTPLIAQLPGTPKFVLSTEAEQRTTAEEYKARHDRARAELRAIEEEETQTTLDDIVGDPLYDNFLNRDADTLEFYRADDTPANPMQVGALRIFATRMISRYARKPNVKVFKNLEDMKRTNAALFRAAAKARQAGDLEHVNAAGMAWGNNVVLFADNIRSEQHARFIIAHETLGHVGFRGLFSDKELNRILQNVANSDPQVRNAAEVYSEARGIPFLEAVEEVLADHAASVDGNTILQLWNWMKNQLNKLGMRFSDDAARYLISLSRKYVRQGVGRSEVNVASLLKEVEASVADTGSDEAVLRFSNSVNMGSTTAALNMINRNDAINGGLTNAINHLREAQNKLAAASGIGKGVRKDTANIFQKFLEGLQTQDNVGRKSKGGFKIFSLLQSKAARQAEYKTRYSVGTKTAHEAKFLTFGEGPSTEESVRAGELLAYSSLLRMNQFSDADLNKMDNIAFYDKDLGEVKYNDDALESLMKLGRMTIEDFRKGFQVQQGFKEVPMTEDRRKEIASDRDTQIASLEDARARAVERVNRRMSKAEKAKEKLQFQLELEEINEKYDQDIENTKRLATKRSKESTYEVPNMVDTPAWFKGIKEDSVEFKVYNEFFDTMARSHVDVLASKYVGALHEQTRAITAGIAEAFDQRLSVQEEQFINAVVAQYDSLRMEDSSYKGNRLEKSKQAENEADDFLNYRFSRSFYSDAALNDFAPMVKGYTSEQVRSLVSGLRMKLTSKIDPDVDPITDSSIWALKNRIEERTMFADSLNDDQLYAKRSIAGSYVPLTREGEWQVRVRAYVMENGVKVPVKIKGSQQDSLAFFKTDAESKAEQYQDEMNTILGGEYELRDADGNLRKVKLEAVRSQAVQTPDLVDVLHYDEVMYSLSKLGLALKPEQREILVKKVTSQNSRARSNLQRAGVAGWDKDVVRSASAFLEQQAYVAANKEFRHQFDGVLDDERNWFGDPERVEALRKRWEAATGDAKVSAGREYFQEKYWYDNAVKIKDGKEAGWGNYYKERSKSLLDWMDSTGDIVHVDDIWAKTEWGLAARTAAAVSQLGGSIATGVTQMLSLPTNSWAYLAATNPKNGFGLGLGAGKAGKLLAQMAMAVGNVKYGDLEYITKELETLQNSNAKTNKDGLTLGELDYLRLMTEEQRLDAAQFNALTGTSRGRKISGNPVVQKIIKVWMFPFQYSEQFNRRVTLLAAYRGEYERRIAAGETVDQAAQAARTAAAEAVDKTQGDYSQYNRPAFFRGGLQAFVYMYKQYPIMMIQLLKNMDNNGRIIMLGSLLLLSGLRGLPGSDDLLDMIDGLLQRLGLTTGSVEKEFARLTQDAFGDELGGVLTPIMMRGLFDHVTGWSFSNRLGLGDIVPGTGLLKPSVTDKEIIREIENIAGAPTAFITGVLGYIGSTVPQVIQGRKDTLALLQDSPVRAVANLGQAFKFMSTGAITDSKGAVVSENVTAWEVLGKAMGWYPSRAQKQMDWMAADAQESKYMSMVKTDFTREAVAAQLAGDNERYQRVLENVREWNDSTRGTRLEIRNFARGVSISFRESSKPLAARYLKASARGGRAEAKEILQLYGVDEDVLYGSN